MDGISDILPDFERERGTVLFLRARETKCEEDLRELDRWVGDDPGRRRLIAGLTRVWNGVGKLGEEIRADSVSPEPANDDVPPARPSRLRSRGVQALAASIALAMVVGTAALLGPRWQPSAEQEFSTEIGARKHVTLDDGTKVVLDAASHLTIDYREDRRIVRISDGQAFFDVAHDPDRPFHVEATGFDIEAIGTKFNVTINGHRSSVSLVEGSVRVSNLIETSSLLGLRHEKELLPIITLEPGQAFEYDMRKGAKVRAFDPSTVSAWQQGRIVFDDLPLPDAVAMVNRYSHRAIVIDDHLPATRMTGVFDAGDGMAFAETAATYIPNARLEATDDRILITIEP